MRALALALLLLLPFALPAQAHAGHSLGMEMSDLRLVFDPLTQSTQFLFHLQNNDTGKTGALFARVTMLDDQMPLTGIRVDSRGLLPAEGGDFVASVPLRVSLRACIVVAGTASNEWPKVTGTECAQTSGLSVAPMELPFEAPPVTDVPEIVADQLP